jgi:hypothetical protein
MSGTLVILSEGDEALAVAPAAAPEDEAAGAEQAYEVQYVTDPRWGRSGQNKPLVVTLKAGRSGLKAVVARELLGVYVTDGWNGVDRFSSGIFGLDRFSEFILKGGLRENSILAAQGDQRVAEMGQAVAEDRRPLWQAFETSRRELQVRVREFEQKIQRAAVAVAHERVEECRALVLAETMRYLSLAEPREQSARAILRGGRGADAIGQGPTGGLTGPGSLTLIPLPALGALKAQFQQSIGASGLTGPDGPALLVQLQELTRMTDRIDDLRTALLAAQGIDAANRHAPLLIPQLTPFVPLILSAQQLAGVPDAATTQGMAQALAVESSRFSEHFARAGAGFPILFKLIGGDTTDPRVVAVAVTEILRDAWQACHQLDDELVADPEKVWQLLQLMNLTVARRFAGDAEFAERVAADAFTAHKAELSAMEIINDVVQGVDAALMLVPIPVVQLGVALANLIAGMNEVIDTYLREGVLRRADRAALDPSLALASAPSFIRLVVQAVILAISVIPVPGLAAEVEAARHHPPLPL